MDKLSFLSGSYFNIRYSAFLLKYLKIFRNI